MSTGIIQLYTTQHPIHTRWSKRGVGIVMFVKDNAKRSYFYRFYCANESKIIWEQELYNEMELHFPKDFLITFEGHDNLVALNFTVPEEAKHFYDQSQMILSRKTTRKSRPRSTVNTAPTLPLSVAAPDEENMYEEISSQRVTLRKHNNPPPPPMGEQNLKELFGKNRVQVKKIGGLSKQEISGPANFVHVAHVGFSKENGIDSHGQADVIQGFLQKCGLVDAYKNDRSTKAFIDDFIESKKVIETITNEKVGKTTNRPKHPPQLPQRKNTTRNNTGSRRPGADAVRGPPMPTIPAPILSDNQKTQYEGNKSKPNGAQAGPPPPTPPPPPNPPPAPQPPPINTDTMPTQQKPKYQPPVEDNRSMLMDSIRQGATLKVKLLWKLNKQNLQLFYDLFCNYL